MPLSDMNGAGSFWKGAWTFRTYWGAFAILLLVAAHLLWRRGTEVRLKPRLERARRRLTGAPGWIVGAALVVFITPGAFAFYNTNVLNDYQTRDDSDEAAAEFEKRLWKYKDLPQPTIADVTPKIALYPEERRAVTTGCYRADGKWDVTVPVEAKKLYVDGKGVETETPLAERIEIGLFTAGPGRDAFTR